MSRIAPINNLAPDALTWPLVTKVTHEIIRTVSDVKLRYGSYKRPPRKGRRRMPRFDLTECDLALRERRTTANADSQGEIL